MPDESTPITSTGSEATNPFLPNISEIINPDVNNVKPAAQKLAEDSISNLQTLGLLPNLGSTPVPNTQPATPLSTTLAPARLDSASQAPTTPPTAATATPSLASKSQAPIGGGVTEQANPVKEGAGLSSSNLSNIAVGDSNAATSEVNKTITESELLGRQAITDKVLSESKKADKVLATQIAGTDEMAKLDAKHKIARDQAEREAASETANWMHEMDNKAKEQPSPGHWWHNQSTFAKVLWLASLGFGALSQSYGGKNPAADLIMSNIKEDIAQQRESQRTQLETLKLKGTQLDKAHSAKLADLQDDYTHSIGRLNSILNATLVRAQSASTDDLKAAYSNAASIIADEKVKIATKRFESTRSEKLNIIDQQAESSRNNARIANESNQKALDRAHQTSEKVLDRQLQRDLAEEKIQAQIDKANRGKNSDLHEIPSQSGVSIRIPGRNGQPDQVGNLAVPKDMAKDAHNIISNGQAKVQALQALKESIETKGLPYGGFSNDNEGRQRLAAIADPIIKQLGGRFSPDNVGLTRELILGEDPSSIWQRVKGGSKEEIVKLLETEIKESPGSTKQSLLSLPGINLAQYPDADLVFTTPDSRGPKDRQLTNDEKVEQATGNSGKQIALKTPTDIKEFGDEAQKALPSSLKQIVEDTKTNLAGGFEAKDVSSIRGKALNSIDKWLESHPGGEQQRDNAYALINDAREKAIKVADRLPDIKAKILATHPKIQLPNEEPSITKADVEEELDKAGLVLPTDRVIDILKELRAQQTIPKKK